MKKERTELMSENSACQAISSVTRQQDAFKSLNLSGMKQIDWVKVQVFCS